MTAFFSLVAPLKTIDAETLLATPLKPVHFLVDRLLPPGLHLLAGAPKIGKSWLMMQLCLKVATGITLFEFQTLQSDVLYLCLEDTLHRIQSRLFHVTDTAPENLHFAIMADSLDNGLKEEIGGFLARHPQTRLIIIDTLQRVREIHADGNAYANDYKEDNIFSAVVHMDEATPHMCRPVSPYWSVESQLSKHSVSTRPRRNSRGLSKARSLSSCGRRTSG